MTIDTHRFQWAGTAKAQSAEQHNMEVRLAIQYQYFITPLPQVFGEGSRWFRLDELTNLLIRILAVPHQRISPSPAIDKPYLRDLMDSFEEHTIPRYLEKVSGGHNVRFALHALRIL